MSMNIRYRQMAEYEARQVASYDFDAGWRYDDDHPEHIENRAEDLSNEFAEKFAMRQPDREPGDRRTFQRTYFDIFVREYFAEMKRLSRYEEQ